MLSSVFAAIWIIGQIIIVIGFSFRECCKLKDLMNSKKIATKSKTNKKAYENFANAVLFSVTKIIISILLLTIPIWGFIEGNGLKIVLGELLFIGNIIIMFAPSSDDEYYIPY